MPKAEIYTTTNQDGTRRVLDLRVMPEQDGQYELSDNPRVAITETELHGTPNPTYHHYTENKEDGSVRHDHGTMTHEEALSLMASYYGDETNEQNHNLLLTLRIGDTLAADALDADHDILRRLT